MFDVTEKTVVRFIVNNTEFETKKEARLHAAWLRLEQYLTDNGYRDIETFLKFDPAMAIEYLRAYQTEIDAINLPANPFRYENIQWDALANWNDTLGNSPPSSWFGVATILDSYVDNNQKINAIKLVRTAFGSGLKESKDWVEDRWTSRDFNISSLD